MEVKTKSNFFRTSSEDFKKIPGNPIAYWVSENIFKTFEGPSMMDVIITEGQNKTANNDKYVRLIWEVARNKIGKNKKWLLYSKGGNYRKWYGNLEYVVDWSTETREHYRKDLSCRIIDERFWYKEGITWTDITSFGTGFRYLPNNSTFDMSGPTAFIKDNNKIKSFLALLNSVYVKKLLPILNPTLHAQLRDIKSIPRLKAVTDSYPCIERIEMVINLSKSDWDAYETSWDFTVLPLLNPELVADNLQKTYNNIRQTWQETTLEMKRLEEENNRIFIEAYGLEDELTPDVPLKEITLTCNPYYRYGVDADENTQPGVFPINPNIENRLQSDTIKEFISYAVGCMFGRYSLDKEGLILANAGDGIEEYFKEVLSDQYIVNSEDKKPSSTNHSSLTTNHYSLPNGDKNDGNKKLSGSDSLAESYGSGGDDLQSHKILSERGDLWADQSDLQSGRLNPIQYSRGTGEKLDSRLQKILELCPRFSSGSGDTNPDCPAAFLCEQRNRDGNTFLDNRNSENALHTAEKTPPLNTNNCPLSTISFLPDESGILPLTEADDFTDDLPSQFYRFLRTTFGEEHYHENLRFIEDSIGKSVRNYFLKDFFKDHVQRYKKRPIYWMVTSPKGSFRAFIYLHRYTKDTVGQILNDYVRPFEKKLESRIAECRHASTASTSGTKEKIQAHKDVDRFEKALQEITEWDAKVLRPLALKRIELDLDDGVKVNYAKIGDILEPVKGLNG